MIHKAKHIKGQADGFLNMAKNAIYSKVAELQAECYVTPEPIPFADRLSGDYKEVKKGQTWGSLFECGWFHVTGHVPESAKGKKLVLMLDFNGEGCVYDADGCAVRGITNVTSTFDSSLGMPGKRILSLTPCSNGNEIIDLWIDTGCNDLFGNFKDDGKIVDLDIAVCNDIARNLYYDVVVLRDLLNCVDENSARYYSILYSFEKAFAEISDATDDEIIKARTHLAPELAKQGGDPSLSFNAIGHAHMDLAWLWPIRETRRKGARTFSTVIEMMERYPDYIFGGSQPQLYQWVKEDHPLLYAKVKEKIKEGRWEVQGGMWVESDTNVPSGESLVRQFLYGKRFFREEFGIDVKSLWLPDVFGYSAAIPQIMKKSGCDFFTTIKLSWSRINKFPYHTFTWEGLNSDSVLVHMPPEGTYNSAALPHSINDAEKNYQERGICDEALTLFGIGDGGGGPGPEHLERLERIKNLDGISPVKQDLSCNFFNRIVKKQDSYPKYKGELYVEIHQGTLTTQANNKKYNRLLEKALHDAELISTQAFIKTSHPYPQDRFNEIWKEVLLYQFHDILPGSSIKRVYDESVERYKTLLNEVNSIKDCAINALCDNNNQASCYNSLPWERRFYTEENGQCIQVVVPALEFSCEKIPATDNNSLHADDNTLENNLLKVTFNKDGFISSIIDKTCNRECIKDGSVGNELKIFTDISGDAWDFVINYRGKKTENFVLNNFTIQKFEDKVVRTNIYTHNNSTLTQDVILGYNSDIVDFKTTVNWQERDRMLRAEFPLNISSEQVSCDIQFGNIKRSTTNNTSWDYAKIEVAAHKWIDMSQPDYGIAILNDCKYGYHAKEGLISINLLRSPNYPGNGADLGEHQFSYALYPHKGDTYNSNVEQKGYEYNYPVIPTNNSGSTPFIASSCFENIILETVKLSEDSNDVIVRFYENKGVSTNASIKLDERFATCTLTNLIEDDISPLIITNGEVTLSFSAFEVHTLKLSLK